MAQIHVDETSEYEETYPDDETTNVLILTTLGLYMYVSNTIQTM